MRRICTTWLSALSSPSAPHKTGCRALTGTSLRFAVISKQGKRPARRLADSFDKGDVLHLKIGGHHRPYRQEFHAPKSFLSQTTEKSDTSAVPEKPSNNGLCPVEIVEEMDVAKGNTDRPPAPRTQSRISCESMGLEGVREAARRNKGIQFTALLQHITVIGAELSCPAPRCCGGRGRHVVARL